MANILVSGLINLETTLRVDGFPIEYTPVRYPFFGVNSTVSGVGYNIAKALIRLGDSVSLLSIVGSDAAGELARGTVRNIGLNAEDVIALSDHTAQSVILYDEGGRRQVNVDLKDIQEQNYPLERFQEIIRPADLAVLCNINYSRPMLSLAGNAGKRIATDVHSIYELEDPYNQDFMAAANILFMSDERLPASPEAFAKQVAARYRPEILVVGMGARGALLYLFQEDRMDHVPAINIRPVVNTIGAGDALFSCFVHYYAKGFSPLDALRRAVVFAGYKIGGTGAAEGFLNESQLEGYMENIVW